MSNRFGRCGHWRCRRFWALFLHLGGLAWGGAALAANGPEGGLYPWVVFALLLVALGGVIVWRYVATRIATLGQRELQLRRVVDGVSSAVVVANRHGVIEFVNAQTERYFGYSREELLGRPVELLVPERFRQAHPALRASFIKSPQPRPMGAGRELYGLRKDGSEFPIEIGLTPLQTEDGTSVLSSIVDISARKGLEARFRQVVESAPNALVVVNQQGIVELINAQAETCFGYTRDELVGQPVECLVPERLRAGHPVFRAAFLNAPQARPMGAGRELFGLRKNGTEFPIEIGLTPLPTEAGTLVLSSIVDISARKRLEARFRQVVESAPNALVVVNQQGIVELINAQAETCFGYSREELIGQAVECLVPVRFRGAHPGARATFFAAPQTRPMGAGRELYGLRKDGSEFPIEIGLTPLQTEDGVLVLSSIIDISQRREAERQLKAQAEQLATANRYKSEFLATMSHELRTPLNSILLLAEQLKANLQRNLTPKQVKHAEIILRSGSDLLNLINDILDLSRIEAGRMALSIGPVDLVAFAESLRQSFELQAESRGLLFTVSVADDLPEWVMTDEHRLHQIVKNLVSNALKFTERGRVEVRVFATRGEGVSLPQPTERGVAIQVRDEGPGIPEHQLEQIFQAFFQADSSSSRSHGGSGLGLTISRQLAELLGGVIAVTSQMGRGSAFTLYLPEKRGADSGAVVAPAPRSEAGTGRRVSTRTVLIVEDDENFLQLVAQQAQEHGLKVQLARTATEAETLIRKSPPAAIILDLLLPDRHGQELIRALRRSPVTCDIPIHVISCLDRPHRPETDALEYLVKPVDTQQLDALLRRLRMETLRGSRCWLGIGSEPAWRDAVQALAAERNEEVLWCADLAEAEQQLEGPMIPLVIAQLDEISAATVPQWLAYPMRRWPPLLVREEGLSVACCAQLRKAGVALTTLATLGEQVGALLTGLVDGAADPRAFAGRQLLLVDDDVRNTYSMCSLLDELGIETRTASNGLEALESVRSDADIDLVLMDIAMPVMDGYEAIRQLHEELGFRKPIVALTAYAMKGDREKCLAAGADDYLAKPVRAAELAQVLARWLG